MSPTFLIVFHVPFLKCFTPVSVSHPLKATHLFTRSIYIIKRDALLTEKLLYEKLGLYVFACTSKNGPLISCLEKSWRYDREGDTSIFSF